MLAAMRAAITELLPDTCTILTVTRTPDGMGGNSESWGTASSGVACRMDLVNRLMGMEQSKGASLQPYPQYMLSLPYDTTVDTDDRIVHNSTTYAVTRVNTGQSWMAVKRVILELV